MGLFDKYTEEERQGGLFNKYATEPTRPPIDWIGQWFLNLLKDVPSLAYGLSQTPLFGAGSPTHVAKQLGEQYTGMIMDNLAKGRPLEPTPIQGIEQIPIAGLIPRAIRDPKETLFEHPGQTLAELIPLFFGIRSGIKRTTPKFGQRGITKPPVILEDISIQKITKALKAAKPLRKEQEILYTKERGAKLAKSLEVGERVRGEAGFYAELGQLKGELPKVQFESIRGKVNQLDIDNVFNKIKDSPLIGEWEKLSTRQGLAKLFGEYGGKVPTTGELNLLNKVFGSEFTKTILGKRPLWQKAKDAGYQLWNIPRSVMASFDLSAPFRQGMFLIGRPKQFFPAFTKMFKAFGSEKAYNALQQTIVEKPTYKLMRRAKLALTEMDASMALREERFMSGWAEKIPLAGRGIRASGRAYTGFLNKLRADVFEDLVNKANKLKLDPQNNMTLTKSIANYVNAATGRGSLGSFEKAATALNTFFFSPRLMSSRLTLLNPVYYIRQPSFLRKQALRDLMSFGGVATSVITLGKLMGAEAEGDPRNADFGKVKIGKTRIDLLAGFGQYIRAAAQVLTGKYISSVTGREITLGEGYKPMTRLDILTRQIESKEAPLASLATSLLKGRNWQGEPINIPKEIGNRFVPMVIGDMVELAKEDPKLLPLGISGFFGMGLQVYESYSPKIREFYTFLSEAEVKEREWKVLSGDKKAIFYGTNKRLIDSASNLRKRALAMSKLRKEIETIGKSTDISAEIKKKRIAELNKQIESIAVNGLLLKGLFP